jgi:hypothetical protein
MSLIRKIVIGVVAVPAAVVGLNLAAIASGETGTEGAEWSVPSWQSRIGGAGRWQSAAGGRLVLEEPAAVYTLSPERLDVHAAADAGGRELCRALSRYRGGYPMDLDADYVGGAKWYTCTIRPN